MDVDRNIVKTICSGCMRDVVVDLDAATTTMQMPANGRRGSLHVPAHTLTGEVTFEAVDDATLAHFECPAPDCDYEDSVYVDPVTREALS